MAVCATFWRYVLWCCGIRHGYFWIVGLEGIGEVVRSRETGLLWFVEVVMRLFSRVCVRCTSLWDSSFRCKRFV
jgi:hypothetical protein